MESCLTLVTQAIAAGVTLELIGDNVSIRGARKLAPLVKPLLERKQEILEILRKQAQGESVENQSSDNLQESEHTSQKLTTTKPQPADYCPKCKRYREYRDVIIHKGASTRRDCLQCGAFIDFPKWHGTNCFN